MVFQNGDIVYIELLKGNDSFKGLAIVHNVERDGVRWILPTQQTAKGNCYNHADGSDAYVSAYDWQLIWRPDGTEAG